MFVLLCVIFGLLSASKPFVQGCEYMGNLLDCGYNQSRYDSPYYTNNRESFNSVQSAKRLLVQMVQVIEANCSPQMRHFGCAALFPSCETGYGPCRSLCNRITQDCAVEFVEHLQTQFVVLNVLFKCDNYSANHCVEPLPTISQPTTIATTTTAMQATPTPTPPSGPTNTAGLNDSNNGTQEGCPPPSINFFTQDAKQFALGWVITWSVLSFISTLLTILTFLLNPSRFQYPWRPIVFLATCFNIHSIGYLFAIMLGRKIVTCPGNQFITTTVSWGWNHVPCILVFGILYYTMMAAFLWWLMLTLSWCLASALKWSNEAISNASFFFHLVAWILPLLMTVGLVASRQVSADELTGVCFIVRDETQSSFYALLFGVIVPLIVFLLIGITFVAVGLISVCRIHSFLRHKGQERESIVLEKLIIRVGVFVSVYMFPAAVLIGCFFYELQQRPNWDTISGLDGCTTDCDKANPTVLIVRVFMFLIIGVFTGVWIWSKKTLLSWTEMLGNCRNCCRSPLDDDNKPEAATNMSNINYLEQLHT